MPTPFPYGLRGLAWSLIHGRKLGLGPKAGVSQRWVSWGRCDSKGRTPLDLECLVPSAWAHNLQIQGGSPTAPLQLHQASGTRNDAASGREGGLSKVPGGPRLLGVGFPPPTSFHAVAPPMDHSSVRAVSQALGFV